MELFHSIGVFFFRKNILVKSLSGLLNVILHIVLPKYCEDLISFKGVDQHIERAEKDTILSDDVLDTILSECDKNENSPKLCFDCVEFQWQNLTCIRIILREIDFMD